MARTLRKTAYMATVGTAFVGLLMLSVSRSYLSDGRFTETLWHRTCLSYGVSPEWAWGDILGAKDFGTAAFVQSRNVRKPGCTPGFLAKSTGKPRRAATWLAGAIPIRGC
jgi:hypothetical protein